MELNHPELVYAFHHEMLIVNSDEVPVENPATIFQKKKTSAKKEKYLVDCASSTCPTCMKGILKEMIIVIYLMPL